jgi:outer membrane protein, heavy metal efflux system
MGSMARMINSIQTVSIVRAIGLSLLLWLSPALFAAAAPSSSSSLGTFIQQVLENNPAIQAAEANITAARARSRAAGYPIYNPALSVQQQNGLENQSYVEINQTIDWVNKRDAREQIGVANADVAKAQLADLRQQLAVQVLSALAKYQAEQQALALAKERTSLLRKFVALTTKRFKSGDITRIDLDLAQLALSEAITQQADTEVTVNHALQILRATTGFTQMNWPTLSSKLPILATNSINIDRLINKLPTVLVLNQQYQSARARIKLAERERYPDPTIGIQGGQSSSEGERKRVVGVTVSIPLFTRNPYKAEVDAANYDAREADSNRANIIRQARAEIRNSAERYQILYQAMLQWQQVAGEPLNDGMRLIERLWQAGEISSTDYIIQLKQRIDSQIAGVELKGRAWQSWAEWLRASGQVDKWLQLKSLLSGEKSWGKS